MSYIVKNKVGFTNKNSPKIISNKKADLLSYNNTNDKFNSVFFTSSISKAKKVYLNNQYNCLPKNSLNNICPTNKDFNDNNCCENYKYICKITNKFKISNNNNQVLNNFNNIKLLNKLKNNINYANKKSSNNSKIDINSNNNNNNNLFKKNKNSLLQYKKVFNNKCIKGIININKLTDKNNNNNYKLKNSIKYNISKNKKSFNSSTINSTISSLSAYSKLNNNLYNYSLKSNNINKFIIDNCIYKETMLDCTEINKIQYSTDINSIEISEEAFSYDENSENSSCNYFNLFYNNLLAQKEKEAENCNNQIKLKAYENAYDNANNNDKTNN